MHFLWQNSDQLLLSSWSSFSYSLNRVFPPWHVPNPGKPSRSYYLVTKKRLSVPNNKLWSILWGTPWTPLFSAQEFRHPSAGKDYPHQCLYHLKIPLCFPNIAKDVISPSKVDKTDKGYEIAEQAMEIWFLHLPSSQLVSFQLDQSPDLSQAELSGLQCQVREAQVGEIEDKTIPVALWIYAVELLCKQRIPGQKYSALVKPATWTSGVFSRETAEKGVL